MKHLQKKPLLLLALLFMAVNSVCAQRIDLKGTWQFAMGHESAYTDSVVLPGSMLTNGKGNEVSIHTQWTDA